MTIKTLLVAGVATFGLCTGAFAQSSGATTQGSAVNQGNAVGAQLGFATGGNQTQQQALGQGGNGPQLNIGLQRQTAAQANVAANVALQRNTAIPVQIKNR